MQPPKGYESWEQFESDLEHLVAEGRIIVVIDEGGPLCFAREHAPAWALAKAVTAQQLRVYHERARAARAAPHN